MSLGSSAMLWPLGRWSFGCIKPLSQPARCLGGRRRSDRQPGIMGKGAVQSGRNFGLRPCIEFLALFNQTILGDI